MSVEERLAVVETEQKTSIRILREIRDDVKEVKKKQNDQDIKIASLEQSRATTRKLVGRLGIPVLAAVVHSFCRSIGLY